MKTQSIFATLVISLFLGSSLAHAEDAPQPTTGAPATAEKRADDQTAGSDCPMGGKCDGECGDGGCPTKSKGSGHCEAGKCDTGSCPMHAKGGGSGHCGSDGAKDGKDDCKDGCQHHGKGRWFARHGGGGGGGLIVSYSPVDSTKFSAPFSTAGVSAAPTATISWGGVGYFQAKHGFQLGGGGFGYDISRHSGTTEAKYDLGYGGIYLGYRFLDLGWLTVAANTFVGGGSATVSILSPAIDGRYCDSFAYAEPGARILFRATRWLKVGPDFGYFLPIHTSEIKKGDDLGLAKIVTPHYRIGVAVLFGGGSF